MNRRHATLTLILTLAFALVLAATACTTTESAPAPMAAPPPVIDRSAEAEELCHAAVRDEIPHTVASAVTLNQDAEPANNRYVVDGQFIVMGNPDMHTYNYKCIARTGKNDTLIIWTLKTEENTR